MDIQDTMQNKTGRNRFRLLFSLSAVLLWAALSLAVVWAHGTTIDLTANGRSVSLHALFDTGEPMSHAQIVVYAADNPRAAWLTGEADADGNFTFDVDPTIAGEWAISIRTAGHGELIHFNVGSNGAINLAAEAGRSPLQTWLLASGVVAVLGGVAWYFSRPRPKAAPSVGV